MTEDIIVGVGSFPDEAEIAIARARVASLQADLARTTDLAAEIGGFMAGMQRVLAGAPSGVDARAASHLMGATNALDSAKMRLRREEEAAHTVTITFHVVEHHHVIERWRDNDGRIHEEHSYYDRYFDTQGPYSV